MSTTVTSTKKSTKATKAADEVKAPKESKALIQAREYLTGRLTEDGASQHQMVDALSRFVERYSGRKAPQYSEAAEYAYSHYLLHKHADKVADKAAVKAAETTLHPVTAKAQGRLAAMATVVGAILSETTDETTDEARDEAPAAAPKVQRTGRQGARNAKPQGKCDTGTVRESGTTVTIYDVTATDSPFPSTTTTWMVRCEDHNHNHDAASYVSAKKDRTHPTTWCPQCQAAAAK